VIQIAEVLIRPGFNTGEEFPQVQAHDELDAKSIEVEKLVDFLRLVQILDAQGYGEMMFAVLTSTCIAL
jgi:hypothetical protein